ncbi:MAG TPA: ATP-binding cassette domain-containing protein [Bacteroidetes bacterium]|nr:ATP-binding cassette domain-containing protein [Bacteroidota bacterium]HIL57137.1 ATP-binding cassette domain-containing protein [Rhodothermales bacterium]
MILIRDLRLAFGGRHLFDGLTWTIRPGERVGLVGPNGAGKTTLLKAVAGDQPVDGGEVVREGNASIGFLRQDTQETDTSRTPIEEAREAFADALALEREAHELADRMEAMDDHESDAYSALVRRMGRVQEQMAVHDVHAIEAKTATVLGGLGFTADEMERPMSTFSGGWRMRVALAKMLLSEPDVLLLDEPTNHLDIESIAWLEGYLKTYPGAVVLVSHDRYFLDRMTNRTAELIRGQIDEYAGNYQFYLDERDERRRLWAARYENQQKEIAEIERFIERFRYKATKAKQAQSRIKMLEKMERVPPPPIEAGEIHFRFPDPPPSVRVVAELSTFSKRYPSPEGGETVVFEDAPRLQVEKGDCIALVGKNGAGKSTLARILLGQEPFEGELEIGARVEMAHFAQHQAEALPMSQDVIGALREKATNQSDTELRTLLGAFLFRGDDVFKSVSVLSGGERSRLALARTLLSPANFLVLDEPTNHLDLASKDVLAEAIRQYTGSVVLISHDRHFLDRVADRVWYAEDRTVRTYRGSYSEVEWQREEGTAAAALAARVNGTDAATTTASGAKASHAAPAKPSSGGKKTKEEKRRAAEVRQRVSKALKGDAVLKPASLTAEEATYAMESVESAVAKATERKEKLAAQMADPELYADADKFQKALAAHAKAEKEEARLMELWEALAEVVMG